MHDDLDSTILILKTSIRTADEHGWTRIRKGTTSLRSVSILSGRIHHLNPCMSRFWLVLSAFIGVHPRFQLSYSGSFDTLPNL